VQSRFPFLNQGECLWSCYCISREAFFYLGVGETFVLGGAIEKEGLAG
jgi:hypothetical protein